MLDDVLDDVLDDAFVWRSKLLVVVPNWRCVAKTYGFM
jgi:hypothetical protein